MSRAVTANIDLTRYLDHADSFSALRGHGMDREEIRMILIASQSGREPSHRVLNAFVKMLGSGEDRLDVLAAAWMINNGFWWHSSPPLPQAEYLRLKGTLLFAQARMVFAVGRLFREFGRVFRPEAVL